MSLVGGDFMEAEAKHPALCEAEISLIVSGVVARGEGDLSAVVTGLNPLPLNPSELGTDWWKLRRSLGALF